MQSQTDTASSSTEHTHTPPEAPAAPGPRPRSHGPPPLPLTFNVYSETATSGSRYMIGEHKSKPVCAMADELHSVAALPSPFITLYAAPPPARAAAGILGSVTSGFQSAARSKWSMEPRANFKTRFDAYMIAVDLGVVGGMASPGGGSVIVREKMLAVTTGSGWYPVTVFQFSMEMGQGPDSSGAAGVRQEYEWRGSSCAEILRLGGKTTGWRLAMADNPSETLAVCARNGSSLTKFFRFGFTGMGIALAETDHVWQVMAALTGIAVWHREVEIKHGD